LRGTLLAESSAGVLDELEHPDAEVPAPGTENNAKGRRCLAFALSRVHNDKTLTNSAATC
jgi:hypothetical protein